MATRRQKRRTEFGERLNLAREQAGMTQREAAAALGISQGTMSEAETVAFGSSYVVHMARLFNCDPYWLAMGEGTPYPAAKQYSVQAAELARAFDLMPDRQPAEVELKRRLYVSIQQMLVGASQAIAQTLAPAAEPTRARAPSR